MVDSVQAIVNPTADGDCTALAVVSNGEYGVPEGLQFRFPVVSDGKTWKVKEGLENKRLRQIQSQSHHRRIACRTQRRSRPLA